MTRLSFLIVLALALAACATTPRAEAPAWYYKADDGTGRESGPLALWSLPETMAFHALRCNAAARTLEFEDIEVQEFDGARPVRLEAGGHVWSGEERMEPEHGVPVSSFALPLGAPVVTAIGRGAPMRISGAFGIMTLASPGPVRRVVRECRSRAELR